MTIPTRGPLSGRDFLFLAAALRSNLQKQSDVRRLPSASVDQTRAPQVVGRIIPLVFGRGVFLTLVEADRYTAPGSSNGRNRKKNRLPKGSRPIGI